MVSHGRPWQAIAGSCRPWLASTGHGRSWPAMADHAQPWLTISGHGQPSLRPQKLSPITEYFDEVAAMATKNMVPRTWRCFQSKLRVFRAPGFGYTVYLFLRVCFSPDLDSTVGSPWSVRLWCHGQPYGLHVPAMARQAACTTGVAQRLCDEALVRQITISVNTN